MRPAEYLAVALIAQAQLSLYPPRSAQFQAAVLIHTPKSIPPSFADSTNPT